jgi:hypothetical protein
MDFYIGEEDAYLEEASKGTLPVYHYEQRSVESSVEDKAEENTTAA